MKNGILLLPAGIASLRVAEYPGSFAAHTHDELIDNTRRVLWPAIKDALTRPLGEGDVFLPESEFLSDDFCLKAEVQPDSPKRQPRAFSRPGVRGDRERRRNASPRENRYNH